MNAISGGVTAAKGFKASGCAAGIKKNGQADMALVVSETLCAAAGTFTTNVVKAAPVLWDKEVVGKGAAQAVVVNAGIANACTGEEGYRYCLETAEEAADATFPGMAVIVSAAVEAAEEAADATFPGMAVMVSAAVEAAVEAADATFPGMAVIAPAAVEAAEGISSSAFIVLSPIVLERASLTMRMSLRIASSSFRRLFSFARNSRVTMRSAA